LTYWNDAGVSSVVSTPSAIATSGTYYIQATGVGGCTDTASVNVSVIQSPPPPVTFDSTSCNGIPVTLTATGTGIINWYSDAALLNLVQANSSSFSPVIPSGTSATYYITATNNGCASSASIVSAGYANINAIASVSDSTGLIPASVNFTNLSTGVDAGDNFLWLFGDGNSSNTFNASYTYYNGGSYIVMLVVTETSSGCIDTTYLNVNYDGDSYIIVPNVFTPNNDNTNDLFTVKSKGINTLDAEIYDRWGLKLFEWHTVSGGWDGRSTSGVPASDGTYFYIIKAKGYNGKEYFEKGPFTLTK
jgi:gliding motility-associated-like protein